MISSWKNFALLTGTGEKLNVLLKATAVKLRHHQGDPSVYHFEAVRCTQGKLRRNLFSLPEDPRNLPRELRSSLGLRQKRARMTSLDRRVCGVVANQEE